ncbi:cytochrome c oxidase assembly factor 3 homolog, mitochondrial [Nerophis ophidion]|uniref:cytochrome c oxidase assembly factor 3 homolog, mitochondrial n=1 Tax=Nerophis ophidion TaxID=159077 RepID=UPI002ADFF2E4|nr:cytochrome c oxidase assembly factor 3 homolog, mitochondrial [Nerophis ophidion]
MAEKTPKEPDAAYAERIVPDKANLTNEQMHFIRRVELEQWKKKSHKMKARNVLTAVAIGALVAGIYGYTFYSVSQDRVMEELDEEAKRARAPKTGAN